MTEPRAPPRIAASMPKKGSSIARRAARGAAQGLGAALVWAGLSFLLARFGFQRDYYLGILLPLGALLYLLLAWLIYLRDEGLGRHREAGKGRLSPTLLWAALELAALASALYYFAGIGSSFFL